MEPARRQHRHSGAELRGRLRRGGLSAQPPDGHRHPAVYINIGQLRCVSSQARRDHQVASAIGGLLGLQGFDSPAWNSRVMNETDFSLDNVPLPDVYSSQRVREIYSGMYGG